MTVGNERPALTARQAAARLAAVVRAESERFYIALSCKGSWDPDLVQWGRRGNHRRYVWPILFKTRELAESAAYALNPFRFSDAVPGRGRVVSYSIEKTRVRRRAHA